ncbi:uncharacterized protein LOC108666258 [Hyalella azteca]|uniref:Uncharacterized protein LOC108666258 n=1 Tax=Hyalella azteca TaxID=294128 RepID=A0A8B7N5J5_HYAAZ|nr:uncharacterized protein LOC108666258 [Hyalella azteca]
MKLASNIIMKFVQLALLTQHITNTCAAFWISENKGNNCVLNSCVSRTVYVNNELKCGLYCGTESCDFFYFENGLCRVYPAAAPGTNSTQYSPLGGRGRFERARGKPVTASLQYSNLYASNAVDGNNATIYHSSDLAGYEMPWILIDLVSCLQVEKIRLQPYAPEPYVAQRFVDVQILVGVSAPASAGDFSTFTVVVTHQ